MTHDEIQQIHMPGVANDGWVDAYRASSDSYYEPTYVTGYASKSPTIADEAHRGDVIDVQVVDPKKLKGGA